VLLVHERRWRRRRQHGQPELRALSQLRRSHCQWHDQLLCLGSRKSQWIGIG
jgi:hypothetical protein